MYFCVYKPSWIELNEFDFATRICEGHRAFHRHIYRKAVNPPPETTTNDPERGGASGVKQTEEGTRHPAIELHWLPVAAHIKFKSLMLAYRVIAGSAPTYLNALVRANVTLRMLRSSSEHHLALPSVQVRQSRLFSFIVPRWWNKLPITTRAGASLSTSLRSF